MQVAKIGTNPTPGGQMCNQKRHQRCLQTASVYTDLNAEKWDWVGWDGMGWGWKSLLAPRL